MSNHFSVSQTPTEESRTTQELGRFRRGCVAIDIWLQNASYGILHHFLWKSLIVIFTIVLLIGPLCQRWFMPVAGEMGMRILYMIGFAVFAMDMVFNCYLDPKYFPLISCDRQNAALTHTGRKPCFPCGYIGSFNFWCDFASTFCFVLEFSLVLSAKINEFNIQLNKDGFPNPDDFAKETYSGPKFFRREDRYLISLIFKATRVVRLVPPTKVVEISSKIDIFWYLHRMVPCFYWNKIRERREIAKRAEKEMRGKSSSKLGRSSWDGLEIAKLATMKAGIDKEKRIRAKGRLPYTGYLLKKWTLNGLRFLRILPDTNIELNRQIAAAKIQRAWRRRHETDPDLIDGEGGQAWTSSSRETSNPFLMSRRSRFLTGIRYVGKSNATAVSQPIQNVTKAPSSSDRNKTPDPTPEQRVTRRRRGKKQEPSKVGTAMAEVTGQTVAIFLLANLLLVLIFTYTEIDTTEQSMMVILHGQTTKEPILHSWKAVDTARRSSIPNLYKYTVKSGNVNATWDFGDFDKKTKPKIDYKTIKVLDEGGVWFTEGLFDNESEVNQSAKVELIMILFVLLTWFFGVAAFAGPIMVLVVIPIERAVKLLSMLVMDPLGYRSTLQYKNFVTEPDQIAQNGQWPREVLKGMETEFLISTIVRIGSLMKVGFGSAGAEIIRNNLQRSAQNDAGTLILNEKGTMVSCIFLFCDIRSFTDATECLQEEVFVFTNQIAAVVHSICNSYGGSANKNIGDAFLVSWKLEEGPVNSRKSFNGIASRNQADKALLSVVKICMALHHNDFYVQLLSHHARTTLLEKFKDRSGPTVQMGFGLHAGKAVEGAIGSQRKIDATYVSMAVETAEYLESSTKKYGVNMLLSGSFHRLLQPGRRQRCRRIDRLMFEDEVEDFYDEDDVGSQRRVMDIFTYDIDVDALWQDDDDDDDDDYGDSSSDSDDSALFVGPIKRSSFRRLPIRGDSDKNLGVGGLPTSSISSLGGDNPNITTAFAAAAAAAKALSQGPAASAETEENKERKSKIRELVLPTGPSLYSENIWSQADMRRIRRRYTTEFFDTFNRGWHKYYAKEWVEAKIHFEANMERFEDGPSKYFLSEIEKHDGVPPAGFQRFGKA